MGENLNGKPGLGNEDIFVGNMTRAMFTHTEDQKRRIDEDQDKALLQAARYALAHNLGGEEFVDMTEYLGLDERLDMFAEAEGCTDIVKAHRDALEAQRVPE